jgi:diacylglycerol kinase (ATP)
LTDVATDRVRRVYVILNPVAGGCAPADVREALRRHFPGDETYCEIHATTPDERIAELVDEARRRGFDLVVAAGGDGSVAAVADGLVGAEAALGILPIGTANVMARDLGLPLDLDGASGLLAGPHAIKRLDAMRVGDRYFLTQIGIGIDALMIRDTKREHKRRFGRIAYLWTAFTQLLGFQPWRFFLEADGRRTRHRASQVLVANVGLLGQPPLRWGPGIHSDDGRLDVCVIRARTLLDYLRLLWHALLGQHHRDPNVRYLTAEKTVAIATKHPLPVQADGEIIGKTPFEIQVVPRAVRVVVPAGPPA